MIQVGKYKLFGDFLKDSLSYVLDPKDPNSKTIDATMYFASLKSPAHDMTINDDLKDADGILGLGLKNEYGNSFIQNAKGLESQSYSLYLT